MEKVASMTLSQYHYDREYVAILVMPPKIKKFILISDDNSLVHGLLSWHYDLINFVAMAVQDVVNHRIDVIAKHKINIIFTVAL